MIELPTACSGRCSCGGATTVLQAPAARASSSVTCATLAATGVRLLLGPGDREREVLEGPQPDAVAGRDPAVEAVAAVLDLGGLEREPLPREGAVDDGGDPPAGDRVLAELEQALAHVPSPIPSGRHGAGQALEDGALRDRVGDGRRVADERGAEVARERRGERGGGAGDVGRATGGAAAWPRSAAMDVETTPGMPQASMRSKSARSTPTLSAIPWYATPRSTRMPRAPILRGSAPSGSTQQPGWPSRRPAATPNARARVGERRLERADVRPEQQAAVREAQDRVRDQLAGPVVGDLAAALHAQHLDPAGGELVGGREHVGVVRLATQRQHRGVLEEQQLVVDPAVRAGRREALLQVPGLAIGDPAQPARFDRLGLHGGTIAGTPAQPARRQAGAACAIAATDCGAQADSASASRS